MADFHIVGEKYNTAKRFVSVGILPILPYWSMCHFFSFTIPLNKFVEKQTR